MEKSPFRNRVLIVDDDSSVRETLRRLLEAAGFNVVAVHGGAEALMALRQDPTIGLMLLDLEMPDIDGLAVRRAQLDDRTIAAIPTIIVSGSRIARLDQMDLPAAEYLDKPVDRHELVAAVRRYCEPERGGTP